MNKKIMTIFAGLFVMTLVAATLVPYLSNTISGNISVESPITITVDGEESYALDLYSGESKTIESLTQIHVDGVAGHIAEIKIPNFDGVGITIDYRVGTYAGVFSIPVCVVGDDAYYYIGDPSETLDKAEFLSETTFNTAQNLDNTRDYTVETTVMMADLVACDSIPAPIFTAD